MNILLLEAAQQELDEAIEWYANQAPGLGEALLVETLKTFKLITQFPQAWHPLTDASITAELRGLVLKIMGLTATQAVADALGK
ncbi:MAG: hypothetical protein HHJ17_00355 [Rhodoferax sp.]|uniref:type II toxin-antitoxin system RelE/ParE family toxin n=1 Tax=Rhodoferax sp. TaxID=50421 RepID=UPI0017D9FEAF|nr:type II toxin-antitoxin system RelE/ParE family toxin [Rhodoferax sp.]NMM11979.1 hypothetical protein [Rhodoferax sp.]NMM21382.1 hypothetical protein [Rhodoferax sp.]